MMGCLVLGSLVGWFYAIHIAAADRENYVMEILSHARYAQAKERATLVRLLDENDMQKAKSLLYIVLAGNFRDYADGAAGKEKRRACELLNALGPNVVSSMREERPDDSKSRSALVVAIRTATAECGAVTK